MVKWDLFTLPWLKPPLGFGSTAERRGFAQTPGEEQLFWTKDAGISSDLEKRLRIALYWHAQHVITIPRSPTSCLLGGVFFLFLPISIVYMNHSC